MTDPDIKLLDPRDRLRDLNTKAYYLLVALSFIYGRGVGSVLLKLAFTLTAFAAIIPLQDYIKSASGLEDVRVFKIVCLGGALACTVFWLWFVSG